MKVKYTESKLRKVVRNREKFIQKLFIKLYLFIFTAPSGKVKNMTYSMVNETTLIFEWQSLPLKERNGIITHYTVSYSSSVQSEIDLNKKGTSISL